ncbi:S41 family peptidase [Paenibacillus thermotolerans]|uniref:S41 family peptidase n=1 Tax=Paenibacillus thermotolerans TaxID=3027807 RepID=UPI0023688E50|nr:MULTISPECIES: S41 family peptidase [unclassified Paenibacillus]
MKKITAIPLLLAGALIGGVATNMITENRNSEYDKFQTALRTLEKGYYKPVDRTKLVDGAINGMLESLDDPYSDYLNQEETKEFNNFLSPSFVGIGAEVKSENGKITIVAPIKGSPAEKAGLKPGDHITKVDDKSTEGMSVNDAVKLIRGEIGTKVRLTIQRPGQEALINLTIVRDKIPIETVYAEMANDRVGVITVSTFSEPTAQEFENAVLELEKQGMKGLVIDLRQNPGGLLDTALEIGNLFLQTGDVIVQAEDRYGNKQQYKAKHKDIGLDPMPIAVLIDKGSASASEILSAALKEKRGATLVGETSFGKGVAQAVNRFSDGSNMNYTIAKWLTPNGEWIHEKGVKPDVPVKLPAYASLPILNPEQALKVDSFGPEVKTLQDMLQALGYDPGRKDGLFDEGTKKAVLAFQKAAGLEQTGTAAGETTSRLILQLREKIIANDTQKQEAVKLVEEKL